MSDYEMKSRCPGCNVLPLSARVTLPVGWKDGDPLPENLTMHEERVGLNVRRFAFRGNHYAQDRVYFP